VGNILEDKDKEEEVEGVERPAEIARQDRAALFGCEIAQPA
jgi:hypothetical protein